MQIRHVGQKLRGFYRLADYALRWGMIAPDAQRRLHILGFCGCHGGHLRGVRTQSAHLFLWRAKLKAQGGNVAARCPDRRLPSGGGNASGQRRWWEKYGAYAPRIRIWPEKLHQLLAPFATARQLRCPSERTIGRLIADAPDKMRCRARTYGGPGKAKPVRQPRLRKPKHFRAERPGHCVALDSIELRAQNQRRYVVTCTDLHSHFAWAWATRSHASTAAAQFFRLIQAVFPFPVEAVLTDNGSEFQRHFIAALAERLFTKETLKYLLVSSS